jgi:hypothetical protein
MIADEERRYLQRMPVHCWFLSTRVNYNERSRKIVRRTTPPRPQTGFARGRLSPRSRPHLFWALSWAHHPRFAWIVGVAIAGSG